ncbi:MAG TPA: ABC transporter ATP-binding protein [Acidimicrobiales bacterium]|nr:ABC transporter ATP-binding protein [Acidimicrobiales bacterium]
MSDVGVAAVEMIRVTKHYRGGAVKALDGLDLRVERGEFVAVTGPSGCGKSTMLHLLAALDRPTAGTIRVEGTDLASVRDLAAYRRRQVGLVFQLHQLIPHLSAQRNVEVALFGGTLGRQARAQRAAALLAQVDLAGREGRLPTELSGGERQRVAIARALANEPPLLLADEPTGNLDEASISLIMDLFAGLRAARPALSLVVVTHDVEVARRADRTFNLRAGRAESAELTVPGALAGADGPTVT